MAALATAALATASQAVCSRPCRLSHVHQWQPGIVQLTPRAIRATPERRKRHARALQCRAITAAPQQQNGAEEAVPEPIVHIDNHTDPFATIVKIEYGDRLGELLDTVAALRNLGLNIRRARIKPTEKGFKNKFFITEQKTSEKVNKSARLEEIRMTIFNNLLKYHPESGEGMAWGSAKARRFVSTRDELHPLGPRNRSVVKTRVVVRESEDGSHSEVEITTTDRPSLLVDIVKVLKDISVNVVSAEVDTEGPMAKDFFYVTYHGEPLNPSMTELVTNSLNYYLSLAEIEREESY